MVIFIICLILKVVSISRHIVLEESYDLSDNLTDIPRQGGEYEVIYRVTQKKVLLV